MEVCAPLKGGRDKITPNIVPNRIQQLTFLTSNESSIVSSVLRHNGIGKVQWIEQDRVDTKIGAGVSLKVPIINTNTSVWKAKRIDLCTRGMAQLQGSYSAIMDEVKYSTI